MDSIRLGNGQRYWQRATQSCVHRPGSHLGGKGSRTCCFGGTNASHPLCGILSFCLLLVTQPSISNDSEHAYKQANEFFGAGFPLIASRLYEEAASTAESDAKKIRALGGYAMAAEKLCNSEKAKASLKEILHMDPNNGWAVAQKERMKKQNSVPECQRSVDLKKLAESFTFTLWPKNTQALDLMAEEEVDLASPMRFYCFLPCSGNDMDWCGSYLLALGAIVDTTPSDFERALEDCPTDRVSFHSLGGNLSAGLRLGNMIREKELDTGVGFPNTVEFWFKHKGNEEALVGNPRVISKPYCFSACAYAFLGGVQRRIADDAQYGVHQFRSYGEAIGETETQTVTGVLGAYLGDLGIHRDLLQLALWTGPQDVFILSREQLEKLNVVTSRSIEKGEWDLEALKDGTITARISSSDLRYTNRKNTVLLKKQGSRYQVYLITKIPEDIMGQEGYANQCKKILAEGRKTHALTMSVGDDNYWYEYEFQLGSDGLLVISLALSHEVVALMATGRPINIIFYPPNICRPFQIVSPPLPTTNQENTVKAIMRQ